MAWHLDIKWLVTLFGSSTTLSPIMVEEVKPSMEWWRDSWVKQFHSVWGSGRGTGRWGGRVAAQPHLVGQGEKLLEMGEETLGGKYVDQDCTAEVEIGYEQIHLECALVHLSFQRK